MKHVDWHYWTQFLSEIADAFEAVGSPHIVWYRGVTLGSHTLRPTLLRFGNGALKERDLFERFAQIARGSEFGLSVGADEWDVLFQMQHFGVPTRLLDWSEVFGIAIFFATLSSRDPSDNYVYVLNPRRLNEKARKEHCSTISTDRNSGIDRFSGRANRSSHPVRWRSTRFTRTRG